MSSKLVFEQSLLPTLASHFTMSVSNSALTVTRLQNTLLQRQFATVSLKLPLTMTVDICKIKKSWTSMPLKNHSWHLMNELNFACLYIMRLSRYSLGGWVDLGHEISDKG